MKIFWIILFICTFGMALFIYRGNDDLFNILLGAMFAGIPAIIVLLLQETFNENRSKNTRKSIINSVIYEIDNNVKYIFSIFETQTNGITKTISNNISGSILSRVQLTNFEEHFDLFVFNNEGVQKFHYYKDKINGFDYNTILWGQNVNHSIYWADAKNMLLVLLEFKNLLLYAIKLNGNFEITDLKSFLSNAYREFIDITKNIKTE